MKTVTFFSTETELQQLTGLKHNELWDVGFNLDDWDFGFVTDEPWIEDWTKEHPYYEYWMLSRMENYCCGYEHTEFFGKHYYMLYHS